MKYTEMDSMKSNVIISNNNVKNNWTKEELNKKAVDFYKKYHSILNQGNMQSIAKFIEEL